MKTTTEAVIRCATDNVDGLAWAVAEIVAYHEVYDAVRHGVDAVGGDAISAAERDVIVEAYALRKEAV